MPDRPARPRVAAVDGRRARRRRPPGRAVLGDRARVRHAAHPVARSTSASTGERVPRQAVWMKAFGTPARRPQAAPRRARLRERLLDPRAGAARARRRLGDPGPQGREPRPRDVVAPRRARRRVAALRAGVADRERRTRALASAASTAATACSWRAWRRRAWCACPSPRHPTEPNASGSRVLLYRRSPEDPFD